MKSNVLIGAAILFALFFAAPAFAQTTPSATAVTVPIGDWLANVQPVLNTIITLGVAAIVGIVLRFLPAGLRSVLAGLLTPQVDQLLGQAINYGFNTVAGAEKGKTLTVDTHNGVVAQALQYALDHGPAYLVQWMGGPDAIVEKIISRLDLGAGIQASTSTTTPLAPAPAPAAPAAPAA